MKYIMQPHPQKVCIFCSALEQEDGLGNLIVARGESAFIILNRYPYTSGHIMVVPFEHQPTLELLPQATRAEIMEILNRSLLILRKIYLPQGFNLGVNIGAAAGAGIAGHVHFHVLPRWGGDTNFMTTLGDVRVLPEDLSVTYHRIRDAWKAP